MTNPKPPREYWVYNTEHGLICSQREQTHFIIPGVKVIEKAAYDKAIAGLKAIAGTDYRGNRSIEMVSAYNVLRELGEL